MCVGLIQLGWSLLSTASLTVHLWGSTGETLSAMWQCDLQSSTEGVTLLGLLYEKGGHVSRTTQYIRTNTFSIHSIKVWQKPNTCSTPWQSSRDPASRGMCDSLTPLGWPLLGTASLTVRLCGLTDETLSAPWQSVTYITIYTFIHVSIHRSSHMHLEHTNNCVWHSMCVRTRWHTHIWVVARKRIRTYRKTLIYRASRPLICIIYTHYTTTTILDIHTDTNKVRVHIGIWKGAGVPHDREINLE